MGVTSQNPYGRDLGPGGAERPLFSPARGLGNCKLAPRNARAAVPMVTGKLSLPSAKGKRLLGRSKFVTQRLQERTEDIPSPALQILWGPEHKSRRLSQSQFLHLSNGANIIGPNSPKSYLE